MLMLAQPHSFGLELLMPPLQCSFRGEGPVIASDMFGIKWLNVNVW